MPPRLPIKVIGGRLALDAGRPSLGGFRRFQDGLVATHQVGKDVVVV